jgi:hypothetical protein
MSQNYKRFLAILEKWPIDKSKPGRDLGQYLREKFSTQFINQNNLATSSKEQAKINTQFEALENIIRNTHRNKYPRSSTATASGLSGNDFIIFRIKKE